MPTLNRFAELFPDGRARIRSDRMPDLAPDEVRLEVAYAGICGSDLHVFDHAAEGPGAITGPVRMGHEQCGVVAETGSGVTGVRVGQRVVIMPRVACGRCRSCLVGYPAQCAAFRYATGSWAEYMDAPVGALVPVPDSLPLRVAALAEPAACVVRSIERAEIRPGATALVVGAGPLGLMLAHLLPRCGARTVLLSEPNPERRTRAEAAGARVVDPGERDLTEWVAEQTEGRGADVVFEAAGTPSSFAAALDGAATGATIVIVGFATPGVRVEVSPHLIFTRELTIRAAFGIEGCVPQTVALLETFDAASVVSDVFDLDRTEDAWARASAGGSGKVLIRPGRVGE